MSTYEDATKELARIRRQFKLTPEKSPGARLGRSSLEDSFLSSDMPNRSIDRHLFSASMSNLPATTAQSKRSTYSPPTALRSSVSQPNMKDSYFANSRKTSFNLSSSAGDLGASFRSTSNRSNGPTTSVIEAFRELQGEVKVLEAERFEALREKEELRSRILEAKRNLSLQRHRHELDITEKDLQIKAQNDRLLRESEEIRMTVIAKEEIFDSLQRKLQAQQHLQQSLQEDILRAEQKLVSMEKTSTLLRREFKDINGRAHTVEQVMISSPEIHRSKTVRIEDTIDTLQSQIEKVNVGKMKAQARLSSLRNYIDLILKINGELCETLLAREAAKREVMRLTRAITPPRYTWPKEVPYHDVLHAVNESAKWTAEAAVERAALKATESALNNVIRAISPARSASRSRSRSRSASRSARKDSTTIHQESQHHHRSYLDDDNDNENDKHGENSYGQFEEEPEERGRKINRSLRFSTNTNTAHTKSGYLNNNQKDSDDDDDSDDSDYVYGKSDEDEEENIHEGLAKDRRKFQLYQQSLQELLHEDRKLQTKSGNKKRKVALKKKAKKVKKTGSADSLDSYNSLDHRVQRAVARSTSREPSHHKQQQSVPSLQRFLSDVRRRKSLQTVIARQAAITHATRLAAAASAASNTVKLTNANNHHASHDPASSLHRNTTASLYNRKSRHSSHSTLTAQQQAAQQQAQNASKIAFVPSSGTGSSEFNIVASVSRASRATKELNATVASRVKSLHSGGMGELFEDIPHVTLGDLQHQLKAVKQLRKSFEG